RAAHSFKGSSSNVGAIRLMALCSSLEKKAVSNKLEQLEQDLEAIEQEFAQVQELLRALD
ncbi:MAG TPA: Hpt domain-containing protein, partial [Cellvibrio sp.]